MKYGGAGEHGLSPRERIGMLIAAWHQRAMEERGGDVARYRFYLTELDRALDAWLALWPAPPVTAVATWDGRGSLADWEAVYNGEVAYG
jgi:hypothetical protein